LFEKDPLTLVVLELPLVGRVRLADMNDKELDSISEAAMELFKVPSLGAERRSSSVATR